MRGLCMKKVVIFLAALTYFKVCYAGTITHNDYTAGNVITAAGQNTNENTIFNEFNGNIDNTNIKTGGVTSTNILDGTILNADLNSTLQSTVTLVNNMGTYRRPVLQWINSTSVDVENNTGTSNQTCIIFPDGQRCVTENTSSADKYRRFIITSTATFVSGTEDSGMLGASAINTWFALYAVKSQINTANFVIAGTTNTPTQGNYATLNTMFALNGWVYLGMIRQGDQSAGLSGVNKFVQGGNFTQFLNTATGNSLKIRGIREATTAGAVSLTYSISTGTSGTQIPSHINNLFMAAGLNPSGNIALQVWDTDATTYSLAIVGTNGAACSVPFTFSQSSASSDQVFEKASDGSSVAMDIYLVGYIDSALGVGYNPQI